MPGMRSACTIVGDLSGLRNSMQVRTNSDGRRFYQVFFSVEVYFGQTALVAELTWLENVSCRLPTSLLSSPFHYEGHQTQRTTETYPGLGCLRFELAAALTC